MRIFFLWLWTPFSSAFLAFKAFALASALGGTGASFFTFGAILVKSYSFIFSKKKTMERTIIIQLGNPSCCNYA
jgi:hypothetical protein